MSATKLTKILNTYLRKNQERTTTVANPSADQEIGYIITENNIPLDLPMSQETNMLYDGNHHKQKLKLRDKSGSYEADPNKKMHISDDHRKEATNQDGMQHNYQTPQIISK